jgi:hypothetical protein
MRLRLPEGLPIRWGMNSAPARRLRFTRPTMMAAGSLCAALFPGQAMAQSQSVISSALVTPKALNTLVAPAIAPDYFRDHNVGVLEQYHPDYEASGAAIGSFVFHPQATLGTLTDNNVYASEVTKKSDVAGVLQLGASLNSDWSRHSLGLRIDTDQRRYATQSRRNQNAWDLQPNGKLELGSHVVLSADGRVGRYYESPFSNDLSPDAQVLSNYFRSSILTKAVYARGRLRATGAYDRSAYDFATLFFPDGTSTNQSFRNRVIDRFSWQVEYALSPSVAVYVGGAEDRTNFKVAPNNGVLQSSTGNNVLAGISFDISGVIRGLVGAGYSSREYSQFKQYNSDGVSFQARLDFFPREMTTVSFDARRLIVDANLGGAPLTDTRFSVEVDQSLRENLVLIVNAAIARQSYFGFGGARNSRQIQSNLRYQASRWLGFQAEISYRYSNPTSSDLGTKYQGLLFGLSVTARR